MVHRQGRHRLPHQGRQGVVFGAVAADRPKGRCPHRRRQVQILHHGEVVATHAHPWGRATDFEHYPPEKIAFHMRNPTWCRRQAAKIGPACSGVIAELMAVNAIHRLRSAQGILAFRRAVGDRAAGSGVRPGDGGRRPVLPHHQRHPRRRHRTDGTTEPAPPHAPARARPAGVRTDTTDETA